MAFVTRSEVLRTPEEVFAFLVDVSRWSTFPGWGPIPAILRAELDEAPMRLGSRVRVSNGDGSVHHEVLDGFEPGRRLVLRMELAGPPAFLLAGIREEVVLSPTARGTAIERRFEVKPRSVLTAPMAWVLSACLARAVRAHDAVVERLLS